MKGRAIGMGVAGLSAAVVQAQPAPPAPAPIGPEIVVEGRRAAEEDAKAVNAQALAVTRPGGLVNEALARFQVPVCPGIMGLPLEHARRMVDRIRFNAVRAGAAVAKGDGCRANILVVFADDGRGAVRSFQEVRADLFTSLAPIEREALMAEPGPTWAWSRVSQRTRNGVEISTFRESGQVPVLNNWMSHSLIYLTTRTDIEASVVVIDRAAANGLTVDQLADYATMRSLARTRPSPAGAPLDTILRLFDAGGAPPGALTAFDLAYLQSVYSGPANLPAASNVGAVARTLRKNAAEATGGGR